mgnify:FL=1
MITNEKLFEVAVKYYEKGKTKSEIAKTLGVSHVQIGKYLNLAKERGLVEIVLNPPSVQPEEHVKLSKLFYSLYGIEELILVPGATNEQTSHDFIADSLVRYLLETFPNNNLRYAIGMGRFVMEVGKTKLKVVEKRTKWKIVPALNYDIQEANSTYYNSQEICENYSHNWGVSLDKHYKELVSCYQNNKDISELRANYYKDIDFIIGGVGVTFPRNPKLKSTFFKSEDLNKLKEEISGDYLNYYFDESGTIIKPITLGPCSMTLDEIKRVKKRIAIASGYSKIGSISSLLKTGLINVLATDLPTARYILSL